MNKKILIAIGVIIILILGLILYFNFQKQPPSMLKEKLEATSQRLDFLSSKASELKTLALKAEERLRRQGEINKSQACAEVIKILDNFSEQAATLSNKVKTTSEKIDKKTETISELKQLREDLINFEETTAAVKQEILNYAKIIEDPTNIKEAIQLADKLKSFAGHLQAVEEDIKGATSEVNNYIQVKQAEKPEFSNVKVASLYGRVTDGRLFNRSIDDVVNILKETNTDFVFRGFWIWGPIAEKCSDLPQEVLKVYKQKGFDCEKEGYSYSQLKDAISSIKKETPHIIFGGGIPAQRINFIEIDPITNRTYREDEVEKMALDPAKWGISSISKEELQKQIQSTIIGQGGYFPDITNPEFQTIMLDWAKKQIDSGADAIFVDMLFYQARILAKITNNPNHPAVKDSYAAASKMIDKIHEYGFSKGKNIYVGTWEDFLELPYSAPEIDFVTVSPSYEEIMARELNETKWEKIISEVRTKIGKVPIFAFIDWGTEHSPMVAFSQKLTPDEQSEFLKKADTFFAQKNITFIYPVHGGFMGKDATTLSFGKYKIYDSLAPEFDTYSTIKKLALERTTPTETKTETVCTDGIDNDGDGLIDNEDGDCWIREGAVFMEDWRYPNNYSNFTNLLPTLKQLGVKTVVLAFIWEHNTKDKPGFKWAIRNYSKLDPNRGTEDELERFLEKIHKLNMKAVVAFQTTSSLSPSKGLCPGSYYDEDGFGGDLYHYQIKNPNKEILIKDRNGNYLCHYRGWGFSVNRKSPDVINYFSDIYEREINGRGFDGIWLDSPVDNYCKEGEIVDGKDCPNPVADDYPSLPLFRTIRTLKMPSQIFISESPDTKTPKTSDINNFPYYFSTPDMDEVAEASQGGDFAKLLRTHIISNNITSEEFVNWIKNRPIENNRSRINFYRTLTTLDSNTLSFIKEDKRYFPAVTLISTIPGIPQVTYYELFGSKDIPGSMKNANERLNHWEKVLSIRNKHML